METTLEKTKENQNELTPAEAFKNKYYSIQKNQDSIYSPLKTDTILFEPKLKVEPKITLHPTLDTSTTLLSKLSKSTAPIKAKLSKSKTNLDHLWITSSTTLTLPLRKSAESVHQMSISRKKRNKERPPSFSFDSYPPSPNTSIHDNPTLYPALLSKVAHAFKESIVLSTKTKDHIQYHDVFDGRDAVTKLASIIKTSDRNLAILIGRSLDHQKFFHDVNYEHRLRDSIHELYQFKVHRVLTRKKPKRKLSQDSDCFSIEPFIESEQIDQFPHGVFTLLTDCYSPTCTLEKSCYSPLCPRRFNKKQNQNFISEENKDRLWIKTVPKSISDPLSIKEKKRQENIFELIYTEKDFVEDLKYVEENWIKTLLNHDCIPIERRNEFVKELFWNIKQVRKNNSILLSDLIQRQMFQKVIDKIGDIFLNHVPNLFDQFVDYGSHQVIGKYMFENEKLTNPNFAKLVESIERAPESRKLELNGYLTKPTTRLGRYNLLLKEILKNTPENHPDHDALPKVMQLITQFLQKVNEESGKTENRFSLELLEKKLTLHQKSQQEIIDLDLSCPERKIIMKGTLLRKNPAHGTESSEFQIYVLDHCLLIIKSKIFDNQEVFKLYRKPIPLALLDITLPDPTKRTSILPYPKSGTEPLLYLNHLGRHSSGPLTLYATSRSLQHRWLNTIQLYRHSVMIQSSIFQPEPIQPAATRVSCLVPYRTDLLIGTDTGVFLKTDRDLIRLVALEKVSQVEVLPDGLILILADKTLLTVWLGQVEKVSQNVAFFEVGLVAGRRLVCLVKLNTTSSYIRALEGQDRRLGLFKDLYIPGQATSIQYFKSSICVGSVKGFQMVHIASTEVQSVLDPNDPQHEWLKSKENLKPISMFKHPDGCILLCYSELAFYIDRKGRRVRPDWVVYWEGIPSAFAFSYPYIIAFDSSFIEIRHVNTGDLTQIITGNNIRCLRRDPPEAIYFVMEDRKTGIELIYNLKYNV